MKRRRRISVSRFCDSTWSRDSSACCCVFLACTSSLVRPRSADTIICNASTRQLILRAYWS